MRVYFAIIVTCIAVSCGEQQPHTYRDLDESDIAQRSQEYRIRVETSKPVYVEGEPIYLKLFIETLVDSPQTKLSWQSDDQLVIRLEREEPWYDNLMSYSSNHRIAIPPYDATDSTCFLPVGGVVDISQWPLSYRKSFWSSDNPRSLGGYPSGRSTVGLLPARYHGFVDLGVVSPWFAFEVQRATEQDDNARLIFRFFDNIREKSLDRVEYNNRILDYFVRKSPSAPFRCDGLTQGLARVNRYRDIASDTTLTSADSTRIVEIVKTYFDDCPCQSKYGQFSRSNLYGKIYYRRLAGLEPESFVLYPLMRRRGPEWNDEQAMRKYVQEIGNKNLIDSFELSQFVLHRPKSVDNTLTP